MKFLINQNEKLAELLSIFSIPSAKDVNKIFRYSWQKLGQKVWQVRGLSEYNKGFLLAESRLCSTCFLPTTQSYNPFSVPRSASRACNLCKCTGPHDQNETVLKRALDLAWCSSVAILKFLIILFSNFCKWSLKRQWSLHWAEDICAIYMCAVLCCPINIQCLQCPMSTELWWIHNAWEFSETQSECEVAVCKWGGWQPWEAALSVHTRTCFEHRKKAIIAF